MARLIWSPRAVQDIARLNRFLSSRNPEAAREAVRTIRAAARMLEAYPEIGRPMDDMAEGFREWLIAYGQSGYAVLYHVQDDQVVILALRHQREAGY
jgi:plasmid stabilization system protein ParE